jgi:hypothetical protein
MQNDMKKLLKLNLWVLVVLLVGFSGCYHQQPKNNEGTPELTAEQLDSLSFSASHHYSNNYNFVVKADSLPLIRQQPEEVVSGVALDTLYVMHNNHLVVADIRIVPASGEDSVWVQLARDQSTFGWINETQLLPNVVPDDPISQFISTFSDVHLLIFLVVICVIGMLYLALKIVRANAFLVHVRDIDSFYPTLLALLVAASATFYASIQLFAADTWRHFYYHPTLNPFSVPPLLSFFLASVWAILIIGLATIDDVRHKLPFSDAMLYLCGLAGVCAVNYIVFSISTLYYVGYPLLLVYGYWAVSRHMAYNRSRYICGNCGVAMHSKGRCPRCGSFNR